MPSWGDIFGVNGPAGQLLLWQVGGQVIGTLLGPMLTEAQQELWQATVDATGGAISLALTPAELADMVVRGFKTHGEAEAEASKSGIAPRDFQAMVYAAGDAPAPGELAEGLRRGLIPEAADGPEAVSFEGGIREGRLADKWIPLIRGLAKIWPTPTDALEALLEGQVDEATARALYERFGGDLDYFQMLYNTRGNAPTPMEAVEMVRRGLMPIAGTGPDATTFQQAFLEGPWRNKWLPVFEGLLHYLPPPRTVTALLREGSIDAATATDLLIKAGLSPELAAAYVKSATQTKTATHKGIAESQVTSLYEGKLITRDQAIPMLENLGYTASEAGLVLDLADHNVNSRQVNSAITKIKGLYVGRRIDGPGARKALQDLGVAAAQADSLMEVWDVEASANVARLTEAQVVSAWEYGILTVDEALAELHILGYTPWDAWVVLSVKNKGPLPNPPAKGPGPSPAIT